MYLGSSLESGKWAIRNWLGDRFPAGSMVLDLGAGGGTYGIILKDLNYIMDAVDGYEPAADELVRRYRTTYSIDIQEFQFPQDYDIIILGDVLEHMTVEDAQATIQRCLLHCKLLLVAVPFEMPQDEIDGNPLEVHVQDDLNFEIVKQRYPELNLILYIKSKQWQMNMPDGTSRPVEYAYYYAKGALNE